MSRSLYAVVVLGTITALGACSGGKSSPTTPVSNATPAPTATPTPKGVENGVYLVGAGASQIAAGRYYSDPPRTGCYWERLSGLGGTLGEILSNDFVDFDANQLIVDINPNDVAFSTDADCGGWYNSERHGAQPDIPPGTWNVGSQLTPGRYQAAVGSGCYWERLRCFDGSLGCIIANDFIPSAGNQIVEIRSNDAGFNNDGDCGTWTRLTTFSSSSDFDGAEAEMAIGQIKHNRDMNRRRSGFHRQRR